MVDWWSLGICVYQFIIGCTPYWGQTVQQLFDNLLNPETKIEWPDDEYFIPSSVKEFVHKLLVQDPDFRLGSKKGAAELKSHQFFEGVDFNNLLKKKSRFIPQLDDDDDTSYFDSRQERYSNKYFDSFEDPIEQEFLKKSKPSNEIDSSDSEMKSVTDECMLSKQTLNSSFSSCSAKFSEKIYRRSRSRSELSPDVSRESTQLELSLPSSTQVSNINVSNSSPTSCRKKPTLSNVDSGSVSWEISFKNSIEERPPNIKPKLNSQTSRPFSNDSEFSSVSECLCCDTPNELPRISASKLVTNITAPVARRLSKPIEEEVNDREKNRELELKNVPLTLVIPKEEPMAKLAKQDHKQIIIKGEQQSSDLLKKVGKIDEGLFLEPKGYTVKKRKDVGFTIGDECSTPISVTANSPISLNRPFSPISSKDPEVVLTRGKNSLYGFEFETVS